MMTSKEKIIRMSNECLKLELECLSMWKKGIYHRKAIQIKLSEKNIKWYQNLKKTLT